MFRGVIGLKKQGFIVKMYDCLKFIRYFKSLTGVTMKSISLILCLLFSFNAASEPSVSQILESKKVAGRRKLLGKFHYIKKDDKRNPVKDFEFFFSLTNDKGKGYAYPVVITDEKVIKKIRAGGGQQFLIYATPDQKRIWVGENPKVVQVLKVSHANAISLGSLSPNDINISSSNNYQSEMREKGQPDKATINGVNDTVTNAVIFGAGAALLGSILLGK